MQIGVSVFREDVIRDSRSGKDVLFKRRGEWDFEPNAGLASFAADAAEPGIDLIPSEGTDVAFGQSGQSGNSEQRLTEGVILYAFPNLGEFIFSENFTGYRVPGGEDDIIHGVEGQTGIFCENPENPFDNGGNGLDGFGGDELGFLCVLGYVGLCFFF